MVLSPVFSSNFPSSFPLETERADPFHSDLISIPPFHSLHALNLTCIFFMLFFSAHLARDLASGSMDFTDKLGRDPVTRILQRSVDERRSSFDGRVNSDSGGTADTSDGSVPLDLASDTEGVSSCSNSAGGEPACIFRRPVCTPGRFLQEPQAVRPRLPLGSVSSAFDIKPVKPRPTFTKRSSIDGPVSSPVTLSTPRSTASPIGGAFRSASPIKLGITSCSPSQGMTSPLRSQASLTPALSLMSSIESRSTDSLSSILNLADVRKAKKGVNHIEDVHSLRLLYNRQLQWPFANARADCALAVQRVHAEVYV